MKSNFEIVDNYALSYHGKHIDLHNCFVFEGYDYDIPSKTLKLYWKKSLGDWATNEIFKKLTIVHLGISFLNIQIEMADTSFSVKDKKCLGDISFVPITERKINHEFYCKRVPDETDDILYVFQSGDFIRAGCDKLELLTE